MHSTEVDTLPQKKRKTSLAIDFKKFWNWRSIILLIVNLAVAGIVLFPLIYAISM